MSPPSNLPQQLTSFIGREREIATVQRLLTTSRLLMLTGPGGCGKTRLALQVASIILDEYPDGVYFVALAAIANPNLVVPTVAQALGVKESASHPLLDLLTTRLRDKRLLLLLDNFEQLVSAAPLVADLLRDCPNLTVLATSRAVLHLYGEAEFPVPPLALPEPKKLPPVESLSNYEAVALFIKRSLAVKPDFTVNSSNALAVAEVCIRLDGLPLAIELAAARIKVLSPQAMLARMGSRLELLTGGPRNLPERQQTLRGAIAWSQDLLDAPEKAFFRRLSVFVGGCTLDGLQAVIAGWEPGETQPPTPNPQPPTPIPYPPSPNPLDLVSSLVDKSLLQQKEGPDGESRFVMLETIREYALEQLTDAGEREELQHRHAGYFLTLTEQAEPHLRGSRQVEWLNRLETEYDNLRSALHWAEEHEQVDTGLRMSGALWQFWVQRGYPSEGRDWLSRMLALSGGSAPTAPKAKSLNGAGLLAYRQGDYPSARSLLEEGLALSQDLDDKRDHAYALYGLGLVAIAQGDFASARSHNEDSLAIFRELQESQGIARALNSLGEVARCLGDHRSARAQYEESLRISRNLGDKVGTTNCLHNLGYVEYHRGDYERAAERFEESLALFNELGSKQGIASCLAGLAGVACAQRLAARAVRLLGAVDGLLDAAGAHLDPADRAEYDRNLHAARAQLGEEEFQAQWAEGRAMSMEASVELAGSLPGPDEVAASSQTGYPADLTNREVEVLRLVASGLSDAQVAAKLYLSPHTVHAHLHSVYGKIGVTTRTAATNFAIKHGLV